MPQPAQRSHGRFQHWQQAFSLLELVVVAALAAVLAAMAIPSMSRMLGEQRAASRANALLGSLQLARAEAIKHNGRVVLCKSSDGLDCSATGGWEQGWIVFRDTNNNAKRDLGEPVLQHHAGAAQGLALTGNLPVGTYVSFSASGTAKLSSGAFQAGTFTLCPAPNSRISVRKIVLAATGRARLQPGSESDCA